MKKEEIAAQVRQVIIDLCGFPQDQVTEEKDLEKDLTFDILDKCELAMTLEEEFNIKIPDCETFDRVTVGDWTRLVEEKLDVLGRVEKGGETR